jgi:hypothetical protein
LSFSAKKKFSSFLTLADAKQPKDKYRFPVYRDNEMGINEYWQAHIHESVSGAFNKISNLFSYFLEG